MNRRLMDWGLLTACIAVAFAAGCKKQHSEEGKLAQQRKRLEPQTQAESILRIHWAGKARIASGTNSAHLLSIWHLPESVRLEAQTLDKLALAPWMSVTSKTNWAKTTNYSNLVMNHPGAKLLRPLLQDLLDREAFFELKKRGSEGAHLMVAVKLAPDRAKMWQQQFLSAFQETPSNFTNISTSVSGEWTVIGLSQKTDTDLLPPRSSPLDPLSWQLETNRWIQVEVNREWLAGAVRGITGRGGNVPSLKFSLNGRDQNLVSKLDLVFPEPLSTPLAPWKIPTNLVHEIVTSFSALRGIAPSLLGEIWRGMDPIPDQMFAWSRLGAPFESFAAVPLVNASNAVAVLGQRAASFLNPWAETNRLGGVEAATNVAGFMWKGFPFMSPYLGTKTDSGGDYIAAGLVPDISANRPTPPDLFKQVFNHTNLIYYSWELTGPKIESWLYLLQVGRLVGRKAQMPPSSAGMAWLKAAGPSLANCTTEAVRASSHHVSITRNSTIGFSSLELHLIMDWLESPDFPCGLHTSRTRLMASDRPPDPVSIQGRSTNPPGSLKR